MTLRQKENHLRRFVRNRSKGYRVFSKSRNVSKYPYRYIICESNNIKDADNNIDVLTKREYARVEKDNLAYLSQFYTPKV